MPETLFHVRWPDGTRETCYSPSSIIQTYLDVGHAYRVADFVEACRRGLQAASDRVGDVYGGGGCSRAVWQLAAIEAHANDFPGGDAVVRVERFASNVRLRA